MPVIFLTRQVGAEELSEEDQDQLLDEIQDALDINEGALVLPAGWGVTISDDGRDVEDDEDYEDDEGEDFDDEDEPMDSNEEG